MTFERYAARRTRLAVEATLGSFATVFDRSTDAPLERIEDPWAARLFDGPFLQSPPPGPGAPATNLVFVQSQDGNTETEDPAELGGGEIDKHLMYEGLTRVDADAVLAGARTIGRGNVVFSVWHPELVRLRLERGRVRHPIQVILTGTGTLPIETGLIFNVPELRVVILTAARGADALRDRIPGRPWIHVVSSGPRSDLQAHLCTLAERFDVRHLSAIGGRTAATALLDANVVQDMYLTTGARPGGCAGTPYYIGRRPPVLELVLRKAGRDEASGVIFEHFMVNPPRQP